MEILKLLILIMMDKKKLKFILYNIYIRFSIYLFKGNCMVFYNFLICSIVKLYNFISFLKKVVVNYCYFKLLFVVN